jgi:hypothetical protein
VKIKLISGAFGGHSELKINNQQELDKYNVDVVLYNDQNTPTRSLSLSSRLKGKIPKMLEWSLENDYDYYIWVDSKFTLQDGIIEQLLKGIDGHDLCLFNHPYRSTVSDELGFMNGLMQRGDQYLISRYQGEDMDKQVADYLGDPDFVDNRLFACGCFIYSKKLVENKDYNLLKEWFYHNTIYSIQDQLSLPYLLSKFKTNYNTFNFDLLNCSYLRYN